MLGKRLEVMVKIAGEARSCRWLGCVGVVNGVSSGIAGSACWLTGGRIPLWSPTPERGVVVMMVVRLFDRLDWG